MNTNEQYYLVKIDYSSGIVLYYKYYSFGNNKGSKGYGIKIFSNSLFFLYGYNEVVGTNAFYGTM